MYLCTSPQTWCFRKLRSFYVSISKVCSLLEGFCGFGFYVSSCITSFLLHHIFQALKPQQNIQNIPGVTVWVKSTRVEDHHSAMTLKLIPVSPPNKNALRIAWRRTKWSFGCEKRASPSATNCMTGILKWFAIFMFV